MSAILFLLAAALLAVLLSLVTWTRYRQPSVKKLGSVDNFRRSLDALAPREEC